MEFRWVAVLTLWTMLSGPILSQPAPPRPPAPMPRFGTGGLSQPIIPTPVAASPR
jgi:hypothetical protein